jgi:ankyrin repeat protein
MRTKVLLSGVLWWFLTITPAAAAAPVPTVDDLHAAARAGDIGRLKVLLAAHPDRIDLPNAQGRTALMLAAQEGHPDAVQWLLEAGADLNHVDQGGGTVLFFAVLWPEADARARGGLVDNALAGAFRLLQPSRETPASLDRPPVSPQPDDQFRASWEKTLAPMPPELLARKGRVVELLLKAGAAAKVPARTDWTPLHDAIMAGFGADTIGALVRAGAGKVARSDPSELTPLHCAVTSNNVAAAAALLAHGADLEARWISPLLGTGAMNPPAGGVTPLALACMAGRVELATLLIDRGAKLETANRVFARALHCAVYNGAIASVRLLLDRGARVDPRDTWQATPLHYASSMGHLEIVQLLVARRADLEAADEAGYTPLLDAIEKNHLEVVRFLADQGASFKARTDVGKGPLRVAATIRSIEIARYLIERGEKADGDADTPDRQRPLHEASSSPKMTALLLEHGARIDRADARGRTPLHCAIIGRPRVSEGYLKKQGQTFKASYSGPMARTEADCDEVVKVLVRHGADLNAADTRRDTPLHVAAEYGDLGAVRLLLDLGADRNRRNAAGRTPAVLATANGHAAVAAMLNGTPQPEASVVSKPAVASVSQLDPAAANLAELLLSLVAAKKAGGHLDGAIADLTKLIELLPAAAEPYVGRGDCKETKGDLDGAITDYSRAIELLPTYELAYCNRGFARQRKGDLDGAIADYSKALDLSPTPLTYHNRGYAKMLKRDHDGAIADFSKAIEMQPDLALAYRYRGETKKAKGDQLGAMGDLDKALQLEAKQKAPRR